jgi:hypothetical protein
MGTILCEVRGIRSDQIWNRRSDEAPKSPLPHTFVRSILSIQKLVLPPGAYKGKHQGPC